MTRIQENRPQIEEWEPSYRLILRFMARNIPTLVFLGFAIAGMFTVYWYFTPTFGVPENVSAATLSVAAPPEGSLSAPIYKDAPSNPVIQRLAQSPGPLRVGIISGHKDSDSGAVCEDGLTEADLNLNLAEKVVANLNAKGVSTDLLAEFDPRLDGYYATALISIHADSCEYYGEEATGFKIAGSSFTNSEALSICVENAYREATELPYHANTITEHMTNYHAFRKISLGTPAIILETGFMNLDRELLTTNADVPVVGITNGILCYLNGQ